MSEPSQPQDSAPAVAPLSEQMASEATPAEKPAGSPDLWPFAQLPRRIRGELLRAIKKLEAAQDLQGESDKFEQAARAMDLLADVEDALALAAVGNTDGFKLWARDCSDGDLTALLAWYLDRFQVGEPKAS